MLAPEVHRPLPSPPTDAPTPDVATADEELRRQARARLEAKRGFVTHLVIYVAVNAMLWAIWLVVALAGGRWFPWPVFPTAGWGVGLLANAWAVYGEKPITETMIDEELRRLRR
jgi:hypothetical protein